MAYMVGILLAMSVSIFARMVGLDRDRAFYPTVLVVVASCYDLFGVMGGSTQALLAEASMTVVFLVTVVIGFKRNLWIIAAAFHAFLCSGADLDEDGVEALARAAHQWHTTQEVHHHASP